MTPRHRRQRGEGKVGCIVTLLVFLVLVAVAAKIVPYWWSVDQLRDSADELASRAGLLNDETIKAQIKAKAREQEIPEALAPNAIVVRRQGSSNEGTMNIDLRFQRDLDFYGVYKYTWTTDKHIAKPYMDAR